MSSRITTFISIIIIGICAMILKNTISAPPEETEEKEEVQSAKAVYAMTAKNGEVQTYVEVTGPLQSKDRIDLFAEVSGIFRQGNKSFKEGTKYRKGEALIRVDDSEARLNLISQKSAFESLITSLMPDLKLDYAENAGVWENYLNAFDENQPLTPLPETKSEKEKYFVTSRNVYSQYFNIKSQEERLQKYAIYAPFTGVITQANVDPGTLINPGQMLGEFISIESYEMEAAVSVSDLEYIKKGNKVMLVSTEMEGSWEGRVKRISSNIDQSTQSVKVFIEVTNDELREGMYLSGKIASVKIEDAVEVDRKLLMDDAIYIIEDDKLKLAKVEVVKKGKETVVVKGLQNGVSILKESIPGAYEGMEVKPVNQ